jgi:SNF2 family DNA or RNA helicase
MNWNPHQYQTDAMAFALQRDGCGLMLDPGLGKTSITLAVIDIAKGAGDIRKTLVIAPLRVCNTVWPVEARKWDDFHELKVVNLCGMNKAKRIASIDAGYHIYLINPESCMNIFEMLTPEFDMLVLDESTKFKDTNTQRFKALRKLIGQFKRRMILTGTPVPNGLQDLFGQMFVVDMGASLGRYVSHFRMEFCYQVPATHEWLLRRGAPEQIYKRVANRLMRLEARDHIEMPELINNFIEVELPERLRGRYDELERDFVAEIEEMKIAVFNPAAVGTKLRQMANGFIYEVAGDAGSAVRLHEEKLDALEELVEEMQGRPLLVAYEFIEDAEMIKERLPDVVSLTAVTNPLPIIDAFNAGHIPVLIAHPASAGHGLNLQEACSTVCLYGITWNLEHYQQFIARVCRQGQRSPHVVVHHIVCKGTKDEAVMAALRGKDMTQKAFNRAIMNRRMIVSPVN